MISKSLFDKELNLIIANALHEDVGGGDYSSLACIPDYARGKAKLIIKDKGILAGVDFAKMIFQTVDTNIQFQKYKDDGASVNFGDVVFEVEGPSLSILQSERIVLNVMQRMTAIATKTAYFVALIDGTKAKILDTRKTTPGIRALEKWAVRIGGGENHRFALYDAVMLKDNHIDFSGGVDVAIDKTKRYLNAYDMSLDIIVEARDMNELKSIIRHDGLHRILLDNFSTDKVKEAIEIVNGKYPLEVSGNIKQTNIREYAICEVDYISCGALTHSVTNADMSLKAF